MEKLKNHFETPQTPATTVGGSEIFNNIQE